MMAFKDKVLWIEGLFLRPQHFQQQERHFKYWLEQRTGGLIPYAWGLTEIQIDHGLLAQGKFALSRCQGVFADGTPFNMPEDDPLPDPLEIGEQKSELIYLALPLKKHSGRSVSLSKDKDPLSRYLYQEKEIKDDQSPLDHSVAEIAQGVLWTRLRYQSQDAGAFTQIPIAKLIEKKSEQVILDEQFIPSCLHYGASDRLKNDIEQIHGLLHQRGEELAHRLAQPTAGGVGEIADFLMLQIINRYQPLLAHIIQTVQIHPQYLFQILIQLLGELNTLSQNNHRPVSMPDYQHRSLQQSFAPLLLELQKALNWVPEARVMQIPLQAHQYGVHTATVQDRALLKSAEFILAVKAQVPTDKIQRDFPRQTTIATVDKLRDFVMSHTPGVKIQSLAVAPRQIPYHAGFSYFKFDTQNPLWDQITQAGVIAMHFSGDYPQLELELWAIKN